MNRENRKIVRERIQRAGRSLEGKLPDSPRHPKGRNPYAHIPAVIKKLTGESYTELPDDALQIVMEIIDFCENNPY